MIVFISMQASGTLLCVDVPASTVPLFDWVDPRLKLIQTSSVILGDGKNSDVSLVKDVLNEEHKSLKEYKVGREGEIQNDKAAFENLRKGLRKFSFDVVSFDVLNNRQAQLSYHPGRDARSLFMDKNLDPEIRERIRQNYRQMVTELKEHMRSFDFVDVNMRDPIPQIRAENDGVRYWIKPSNVIVNPFTLRLTLIDAH